MRVCVLGVQQLDTRDERVSCELVSERTLGTQSPVPLSLLLLRCVLMHARAFFSGFSQLQLFLSPTFFRPSLKCAVWCEVTGA